MPPSTSRVPARYVVVFRAAAAAAAMMASDATARDRGPMRMPEPRALTQEDRRRRAEGLRDRLQGADARRERRQARNLAAVAAGAMVGA